MGALWDRGRSSEGGLLETEGRRGVSWTEAGREGSCLQRNVSAEAQRGSRKAEPNERCLDCQGLERATEARSRCYSFILGTLEASEGFEAREGG